MQIVETFQPHEGPRQSEQVYGVCASTFKYVYNRPENLFAIIGKKYLVFLFLFSWFILLYFSFHVIYFICMFYVKRFHEERNLLDDPAFDFNIMWEGTVLI